LARRVFISKKRSDTPLLEQHLVSQGDTLIAHSFLQFRAVSFNIQKPFDVIFFGSPRAVDFFLRSEGIPDHVEIACVGMKTAKALQQHGKHVDFIGEGTIDSIAQSFKDWCGQRNTLFPSSNISLHSISSHLEASQKEVLTIYETVIEAESIKACNTYIFTSPSNVDGFFMSNTIPVGARIIAWGESTSASLTSKGIVDHETLRHSSQEELIKHL
jgi:uroporphyrinogen-III synthase